MDTETKSYRWSIIIPVKPGGRVRALEGVAAIEYPRDLLEVIVAEGTCPSRQRNLAAESATGDLLYFLDDDSMVSADLLRVAAAHYDDPRIAAAGGPSLTPPSDTLLQQAFGVALASYTGGGSVRNRYRRYGVVRTTGENELILCNLSFRREAFLANGGLDERLYPNEENELLDRLRHHGWRLVHDPSLAVQRSQRPTWRAFVRQIFTYGRGRAEQTLISRRVSLASLVPAGLLIYILLLPITHNPVYTLPLLCYAGLVGLNAGWEAIWRSRWQLCPLLLLLLPTLHLSYGAGMLWGLVFPRRRREGHHSSRVSLRTEKL